MPNSDESASNGDALSSQRRDGDLAAYAYQTIREAIVNLQLQPGETLRETKLAQRIGVSRTPVREALRRLQGEGFVALAPPNGFVVAEVSVEDVENAYRVIEVLEGLAARLAAERMTEDGAAALRQFVAAFEHAAQSDDLDDWIRTDVRFHEAIREIAANSKLTNAIASLYPIVERVRHMHMREHPEPTRRAEETAAHREVANAMIEGDGAAAEQQIRQIFERARTDNVRLLRKWVVPLRRSF